MGIRALAAAIGLLFAVGCAQGKPASAPVTGDAVLGRADAKVVLIEFAAPTCPICKGWHDEVFSKIRATYIDTNKIKFILRELPSHNPPVDAAIYAIARCAGNAEYFKTIDDAFAQRDAIEKAAGGDAGPRGALIELAKAHGVSADQFEACVKSPESRQRLLDVQADAEKRGVSGTPTLFINDVRVPDDHYFNAAAFAADIDAALLAAGEAPSASPAAPAASPAAPAAAPAAPAAAPAPASPSPAPKP